MSNDRKQRAARAEQMRKEREKAARKQRNVITMAIVAIVLVLIGLAAWGVANMSEDNEPVAYKVEYTTEDAGGTPIDGVDPVVVEVYEDFQCPACQAFESVFGPMLKEKVAAGEAKVLYRPYSFLDERGGSPNDYSKRSTNAAICVYDEHGAEAFSAFHDYLFANQPTEGQPGPEDEQLIAAAAALGYDGVDACVEDHVHFDLIRKAREAGTDRGVTSTPTVYINDKKVEDNSTFEAQLTEAIEAAKQD